jgi:hypothetical protein
MRNRRTSVLAAGLASLMTAACGSAAVGRIAAPSAGHPARWTALTHASRPLDLAGPRRDRELVLAAAGRLSLLSASGALRPFARGAGGYMSPGGEEPYIDLSPGGCFGDGYVYALRLTAGRGVVAVDSAGGVRRFSTLTAPGLIDGIAFDRTGGFGGRLLVTINAGARTTVEAIGCDGRPHVVTAHAPRVEGGIAVAPASFGRFAGDLIAPSETTGRLYAITPGGRSMLVADSALPHGPDVGVESEAFVPRGAGRDVLAADRLTPGNPHPGDDVVLRISSADLRGAGVRAGDLLVATEGGALTDAIRCNRARCTVSLVARGPVVAHIEGHLVFAPPR